MFLEYRKKHRAAEQNTDIVLTMICEYGKLQNGYRKVTTELQFHTVKLSRGDISVRKKSDFMSREALWSRMPKIIIVMMLAFMMTLSGIAPSFCVYAEDDSVEAAAQTEEAAAPAAEEESEEEVSAPEPVAAEPEPEPEPELTPEAESPADTQTVNNNNEDDPSPSDADADPAFISTDKASAAEKDADTEDEDKNKDDEKDDYPAQSFSGSAGGLNVKASAGKGVFPEGTEMSVSQVSSSYVISAADAATGDDLSVVDAVAADITFHHEGKEIQPAQGGVSVRLSSDKELAGDEHEVVHIASGGRAEIIGDASAKAASFSAGHFSVYGIIGEEYGNDVEQKARNTYRFYVRENGGNRLVDTQTVSDGDTLVEPAAPASTNGKVFDGWFLDGKKIAFGEPVGVDEGTDGRELAVYAEFTNTYYVTFYKDEAMTVVLRTKKVVNGDIVSTKDVNRYLGDGMGITGWKHNGKLLESDHVRVDGADIDLQPVIESASWITFESGGGTPVDPIVVKTGHKASAPEEPTRYGYGFDAWYTDEERTKKFSFEKAIDDDIRLYAGWIPDRSASYTVVYWRQRVTDAKNAVPADRTYDFAESVTLTGEAGSTGTFEDKSYPYFIKNTLKTDAANKDVKVKADGSTVYNVYYDRELMTLQFYENEILAREFTGLYGSSLRHNGYEWPTGIVWQHTDGTNTFQTFLDAFIFPYAGNLYSLKKAGTPAGYRIVLWLEDSEGGYQSVLETNANSANVNWNFSEKFNGYKLAGYRNDADGGGDMIDIPSGSVRIQPEGISIYYKRRDYSVTLSNISESRSFSRKFKETIGTKDIPMDGKGLEPPAYMMSDGTRYTFGGWYLDDGFQIPFDPSTTMPANNLQLFAKWVAPEYKVTFDLDGGSCGGKKTLADIKVESGRQIDAPEGEMKMDGHIFEGWVKEDGSLFSFDTLIMKDTALRAKWSPSTEMEITIRYEYSNGEVGSRAKFAGSDKKIYVDGAEARVAGMPALDEKDLKDGWYFKGWKIGTSERLVHTGIFPVNGRYAENNTKGRYTLVLTAQYEQKATTKVTYHSNLPSGDAAESKEPVTFNDEFRVEEYQRLTKLDQEHAGYEFICWRNGSGEYFNAGEKAAANMQGENHLYAMWRLKVSISGNTATETYDGTEKSVSGFKSNAPDGVTVALADGRQAVARGTEVNEAGYPMDLTKEHFTCVIEDSQSGRIKEAVIDTVTDGWLKIVPRAVTEELVPDTDDGSSDVLGDYDEGSKNKAAEVKKGVKAGSGGIATGDQAVIAYLAALMIMAAAGISIIVIRRRNGR